MLFLIYINDIVNDLQSQIKLFADDTSLFLSVDHPDTAARIMQSDIDKMSTWSRKWLVSFNPTKTESLFISRKTLPPFHPPLTMFNQHISEVPVHKHLGILLSNDCTWHSHIQYIKDKA